MNKIFLLLLLTFFSLHSAEIIWADSFKEALAKAQKEDKNLMVLITTETCRWCRKLESETLTDEAVVARLNREYISVHLTRGLDEYPPYLDASGVPAIYFLDRTGQPIIKRVRGYWNAEDYLSYLDDVDYKLGRKTY